MQKIKSETFIFCFGARGKNGLHARLLRGIRPEGVEIARKTVRFSLATCPFFPVGLLKNECGAWLKIRWVKGFLFASLSFPAHGSPKEKEVRPKIGSILSHGWVKKKSGRIATRPGLPAMKHKGGGCYGLISPAAIRFPSE